MALISPDSEAIRREITDRGIRDVGGMFDCITFLFYSCKDIVYFYYKIEVTER